MSRWNVLPERDRSRTDEYALAAGQSGDRYSRVAAWIQMKNAR